MLRFTKFWIFCSLQLAIVFADDIDSDYYFGSSYEALRARDVFDCKNSVNVLYCKLKCKNDAGVCFQSKCYCVYEPKLDLSKKSAITSGVKYSDMILKYNPGRRHHIAHFCPNLDEARKCIRKCMKEGKAAFCGKDHVCYCGHSYSHHQKKDKLDPAKINAGFYDLYMKYFGPETSIMESSKKKPKKPKAPPKRVPEDPNESKGDSAEKRPLEFTGKKENDSKENKDANSKEQDKEKNSNEKKDETSKGTDGGGDGTDGGGEGKDDGGEATDGNGEKTPDNGDDAETSDKPDAPESPAEEGEKKENEPEANAENLTPE